MKFVIHAAALNSADATLTLIDRLVDRLADEIHRIDVLEADLLQSSSWYQKARQARQKVLLNAVKSPPRKVKSRRGPHVKVIEIADPKSVRLADKIAHTPLAILVEDREADGVFLDIIVEELGWAALRNLWERSRKVIPRGIEIVTAGGKDAIPRRIERAVSDAAEEGRPLRMFVLCDSDERWPKDDDSKRKNTLQAILKSCTEHDVPKHAFKKRCVENYIPDRVFTAVRDDPRNQARTERFNAFLRLSTEQRDHFPVKDGLTAEERAKGIEIGFYKASDETDLTLLEARLLPRKPRPLLLLHKERRDSFTTESLRERDGNGELDKLLHDVAWEL